MQEAFRSLSPGKSGNGITVETLPQQKTKINWLMERKKKERYNPQLNKSKQTGIHYMESTPVLYENLFPSSTPVVILKLLFFLNL